MNQDIRNLIITIFLSTLILVGWQFFFETPRQNEIKSKIEEKKQNAAFENSSKSILENHDSYNEKEVNSPTVKIISDTLSGSISLRGLKFDDLTLDNYFETTEPGSANVRLLSKSGQINSYFVQFGWISSNKDIALPDKSTLWTANKDYIKVGEDINFSWTNPSGINFLVTVTLDSNYMFKVQQKVKNNSSNSISIFPYGLIYKSSNIEEKPMMVFHEGAIGVFDNLLKEITFEDMVKKQKIKFYSKKGGWLGFTGKYWMAAIIPDDFINFESNFVGSKTNEVEKFQLDFVGPNILIAPGEEYKITNHLFTGAKIAKLLNNYSEEYHIALFDRAIDYGWFYFITKPMFLILNYIFLFCQNFGVAIILITILIKIMMFPIANKSYKTMQRMKKLQPTIIKLKEKYGGDHIKLNGEMMDLYKKHNLSPLSGCLPLVIQIPVFFSLYKVIFISIEMRHAPFFGWIKDLSSPDPTSIFNLFGMIPWDPPQILMIGIWPLIMGLTMYLQQKMSPEPADPVQAKVMKFLPLFFIFMFQSFPAGLMIYWSWSNILSISQQWFINLKYKDK